MFISKEVVAETALEVSNGGGGDGGGGGVVGSGHDDGGTRDEMTASTPPA